MIGYKALTHDLRPPIQGGQPIFDGHTPWTSPVVACDTGSAECAVGWNFCRTPAAALTIARLWPTGRPSTLWVVEAEDAQLVERGAKCRAPQLTILRRASGDECADAIWEHCAPFGVHRRAMADAVWLWGRALGRREPAPEQVANDLRRALDARGLTWTIRSYGDARDAWAARAAWDARAAWAAWDALSWRYAALVGWVKDAPHHEIGLRNAYLHGLAVALPTGPAELGYALAATEEKP